MNGTLEMGESAQQAVSHEPKLYAVGPSNRTVKRVEDKRSKEE